MNYNDKITTKQGFFVLIFVGIFGFVAYMMSFGLQNIANNKAKNQHNLLETCMYYVNASKDRYGRDILIVKVNDREYRDIDIYANSNLGFPKEYREFILENADSCHKIRYVSINLILINKIYVYGYNLQLDE